MAKRNLIRISVVAYKDNRETILCHLRGDAGTGLLVFPEPKQGRHIHMYEKEGKIHSHLKFEKTGQRKRIKINNLSTLYSSFMRGDKK